MYFDTHAHYDDERFDPDRHTLLADFPKLGVDLVLNPGCDEETSRKAMEYAHSYPHVYAAVGIHPGDCDDCTAEDIAAIRALAAHEKVVAIGEIGLDYYWKDNAPKAFQQDIFRRQLALAQELNLPVIVHDREAHADSLAIVKEFPDVRGVFHCFSGSVELAKELVKLGWMISFTGVLTYKNARKAVEVADALPIDRLMIETDCPYLAPHPHRGEINHSGLIHLTCEALADIHSMKIEEMAEITYGNTCNFFGIND